MASSGTAVILFADIADSTALTERLGDAPFREKARELDAALRTVIGDHAGTPIEGKLLGDGVLAVFTSARQAIEAALACARSGEDAGLPLHLGLHAGDVIREEDNIYGGAVNIASRISGLSAPGEVLVSDIVRGLARTSAGVAFEDRGDQRLKGVSRCRRRVGGEAYRRLSCQRTTLWFEASLSRPPYISGSRGLAPDCRRPHQSRDIPRACAQPAHRGEAHHEHLRQDRRPRQGRPQLRTRSGTP